jgi:UDP-2,3-diacylglucosamine hydrolase
MGAANLHSSPTPIGIIAGQGELPRTLMHACQLSGRPYFLIALEDAADLETAAAAGDQHVWVRLGAIGKALDALRRHHVSDIVMAGKVLRPKIAHLRPDMKGARLLARLGSSMLLGDNELLSEIVLFLEEEGFRIVGAEDIVTELLTPEGLISSVYPDKKSQGDIEYGAKIARGIGALDIGQSVIVQNHQVLGVEAIEGTDGLIVRCAGLKPEDRGGVLVKVKKPHQERRVDLPTIGVRTVELVAHHGFAGIAVEAGASLIVDRREVSRLADSLGVFVVGFSILE